VQQSKRREQRASLVRQGIDNLDLWLQDLIRTGLAGVEMQKTSFWEKQAARLVDAQAPGLAARVRRLALIPGSSPRWPEQLLCSLGSLALLIEAFRRLDSLNPGLQADVRGLVGWTLKEDDVVAHGDVVTDTWLVLCQWQEDEDRLRMQRTWMHGLHSRRPALVLQFAVAGAPFATPLVPGTQLDAALAFWPSNYPQRALIRERLAATRSLAHRPPASGVQQFLAGAARALAVQPWLDSLPAVLRDVVLVPEDYAWRAVDADGAALRLIPGEHWPLLAFAGSSPFMLVGEWRDGVLRPLAMADADRYVLYSSVT
jgi:hypothetical protein